MRFYLYLQDLYNMQILIRITKKTFSLNISHSKKNLYIFLPCALVCSIQLVFEVKLSI